MDRSVSPDGPNRPLDALREVLRCATAARRGGIEERAQLGPLSRAALDAGVPPRLLPPVAAIARDLASRGYFQAPLEIGELPGVARANEGRRVSIPNRLHRGVVSILAVRAI